MFQRDRQAGVQRFLTGLTDIHRQHTDRQHTETCSTRTDRFLTGLADRRKQIDR